MTKDVERGVALGRVEQPPKPGADHKRLEVFIGKWINEGQTIASADAPSVKILTSDIYEWMPGRFFVLHIAYGRIGNIDVGGTEIIGYETRTTAVFTDNGKTQTARHERLDDSGNWVPSMDVTLTKVE